MAELKRLDSNYKDEDGILEFFCNTSLNDEWLGSNNMDTIDWENRPNTLFNQLYNQKIYDGEKSGLYVYEEDEILCCVGLHYIEEIDCCVASRVYAKASFNKFKKMRLLSDIFDELWKNVITPNYSGWINFVNEYNIPMMNHLYKVNESGKKFKRKKTYCVFEKFEKELIYKDTKQFAIFHIVDESKRSDILEYLNAISI
jgi:hypothetical protein